MRPSRVQGHSDVPLNEFGERQAQALAERLKMAEFDEVHASDLSRAYRTARVCFPTSSIQKDERLRESIWGTLKDVTGRPSMKPSV